MVAIAKLEIIPKNMKLDGFSLIQETKKMAEKSIIQMLLEKSKDKALPTTNSYRMRTCTVENESFG